MAEAKRPRSLQSCDIHKETTWDTIYWPGIWNHRTLDPQDKRQREEGQPRRPGALNNASLSSDDQLEPEDTNTR